MFTIATLPPWHYTNGPFFSAWFAQPALWRDHMITCCASLLCWHWAISVCYPDIWARQLRFHISISTYSYTIRSSRHMMFYSTPPLLLVGTQKMFFSLSESLKATLISLLEHPCGGAIYNLAGRWMINWRRAWRPPPPHFNATADDAFCSEGVSS